MKATLLAICTAALLHFAASDAAAGEPYESGEFKGRIAYSADGNHNDPDDWAASPVALAIFAECGLKDRLVHFHYNCILPQTDPQWEKIHADCVLGAAERYGYDRSLFYDCRQDLDGTVAAIARAIDKSSADDPLYFIVAGPMQVPVMGILKSNPEKQKYVYCISHSRWNDGFSRYKYTHTKRDVIATGINWVQIPDQNRLLSLSPYGRPASDEQFAPFFWMRDSSDPKVRFLWDCVKVSTRPDPSDAGMAYFLATGDVSADPAKLRRLLEDNQRPQPLAARQDVRLEAENFRNFEGYEIEDRNDRNASHRLQATLKGRSGRIHTAFNEPYTTSGRYDVDVRYFDEKGRPGEFTFAIAGAPRGSWKSSTNGGGWTSHTIRGLEIKAGDEIEVRSNGAPGRIDYVQLNLQSRDRTTGRASGGAGNTNPKRERGSRAHPRFTAAGELDDPQALPGQIIAAGSNPGYLKYNGGGIAFLCGPDNPEDFLFLGKLGPDGTRSGGGQEEIIRRMGEAGVNAFHCQLTRLQRCNVKGEGDDTHCPFIDHDPAEPLNEKVLDQWDGWLSRLEAAGIVVHLEFYNDATDVERMGWKLDENGELHPDERRFFEGIVNRFKHHRNIIWGIEESLNKLPRERTPHFRKLSELIARTDDRNHPIVHSFVTPDTAERDLHPDAVMSGDYRDDPHIDIVTWLHVAPHGEDLEAQHQAYLKWARRDNDRFIPMKNETEYHRINRTTARRQQWACALAGMHALEAQHSAGRPNRDEWLADDGKVVVFMERTDFHRMRPRDDLTAGSTKWILASQKSSNRAGESYIAYTYDASGPIGFRNLPAGTYDLLWFDTVSGKEATQESVSASGDASWNKPDGIGSEVALYLKRRR